MKNKKEEYSFKIGKKEYKLEISLKNKILHIQRVDKNAIDITNVNFSIQLTGKDGKFNQQLNFFIAAETKLSFADTIYFSVSADKKLCWRFPIPAEVKVLPHPPADMISVLSIGKESIDLKHNKKYWEPTMELPIPDAVKSLLKQWDTIAQVQVKLQKDVTAKNFSSKVEKTEAFKKYDKSLKNHTDTKIFINTLLEKTTIKELGLENRLKGYENMTFSQAKEAVAKKIGDELTKAWSGKVQILFQSKSLSWKQQIVIKHFIGDKQ